MHKVLAMFLSLWSIETEQLKPWVTLQQFLPQGEDKGSNKMLFFPLKFSAK